MTARTATSLFAILVLLAGCNTAPTATGSPAPGRETATRPPALDRFTTPADGILSGGRISADDLPALRAAGIAHVIDLTPDAETPGFDEAAAVRAAGMRYDNLPIAGPGDLGPEAVSAFDRLLRDAEGPVLVHCASGNRVGALAALRAALVAGQPEEAAIAEGKRWGLRSLEGEVRSRLARERCVAAAQGPEAIEACAAGG